MPIIDKKTVEHLAELARVELKDEEKEKLAGDLEKILKHFEELKEVNTDGVRPMDGGTSEENVTRGDETSDKRQATRDKLAEAFPEENDGFLKVPPVFSDENYES